MQPDGVRDATVRRERPQREERPRAASGPILYFVAVDLEHPDNPVDLVLTEFLGESALIPQAVDDFSLTLLPVFAFLPLGRVVHQAAREGEHARAGLLEEQKPQRDDRVVASSGGEGFGVLGEDGAFGGVGGVGGALLVAEGISAGGADVGKVNL